MCSALVFNVGYDGDGNSGLVWISVQVYQHEIKVIMGNIRVNKCHITGVI